MLLTGLYEGNDISGKTYLCLNSSSNEWITVNHKSVQVWDNLENQNRIYEVDDEINHVVSYSNYFILATSSPEVLSYNLTSGEAVGTVTRCTAAVNHLYLNLHKHLLACACDDFTARVIPLYNNDDEKADSTLCDKQLVMNGHEGPVLSVAINASGTLLASSSCDGNVKIWSLDTQLGISERLVYTLVGVLTKCNHPSATKSTARLVFSSDDKCLAVACSSGIVRLYNSSDWSACTDAHKGKLYPFNDNGVSCEPSEENDFALLDILFSSCNHYLIASRSDGFINGWSLTDGSPVLSYKHHLSKAIHSILWHSGLSNTLTFTDDDGCLGVLREFLPIKGKTNFYTNQTTVKPVVDTNAKDATSCNKILPEMVVRTGSLSKVTKTTASSGTTTAALTAQELAEMFDDDDEDGDNWKQENIKKLQEQESQNKQETQKSSINDAFCESDNDQDVSLEKIKASFAVVKSDGEDDNSDIIDDHVPITGDKKFVLNRPPVNIKWSSLQVAFQPGSTIYAISGNNKNCRYLLWNNIGVITQYRAVATNGVTDIHDNAITSQQANIRDSIEIEFHDTSFHHSLHYDNSQLGFNMAVMNDKVLVLAACGKERKTGRMRQGTLNAYSDSENEEDRNEVADFVQDDESDDEDCLSGGNVCPRIQVTPLTTGSGLRTPWSLSFSHSDNILGICAGSWWLAVITYPSSQLLILTHTNIARHAISLPLSYRPFLTCTGRGDWLCIVTQSTPQPLCPTQKIANTLYYFLINVKSNKVYANWDMLPLSAGKSSRRTKLTWIGFATTGDFPVLTTVDSWGIIRVLNYSSFGCNTWTPVLNLREHLKKRSDHYFVVDILGVPQLQAMVLHCARALYPVVSNPRPVMTLLSMRTQFYAVDCGINMELCQLEENLLLHEAFKGSNIVDVQAGNYKLNEVLLKLFAAAITADKEMRAWELACLMPDSVGIQLAIRYAANKGRIQMAEKLGTLARAKQAQVTQELSGDVANSSISTTLSNNVVMPTILNNKLTKTPSLITRDTSANKVGTISMKNDMNKHIDSDIDLNSDAASVKGKDDVESINSDDESINSDDASENDESEQSESQQSDASSFDNDLTSNDKRKVHNGKKKSVFASQKTNASLSTSRSLLNPFKKNDQTMKTATPNNANLQLNTAASSSNKKVSTLASGSDIYDLIIGAKGGIAGKINTSVKSNEKLAKSQQTASSLSSSYQKNAINHGKGKCGKSKQECLDGFSAWYKENEADLYDENAELLDDEIRDLAVGRYKELSEKERKKYCDKEKETKSGTASSRKRKSILVDNMDEHNKENTAGDNKLSLNKKSKLTSLKDNVVTVNANSKSKLTAFLFTSKND